MDKILSVSSLNLYVKSILEQDENLRFISVEGELSNFKKYPSGHCYFSLKDATSAIRGVMFSFYASNLSFKPENGMKVIARGRVSLYEATGQYQLYIDDLQPLGAGALAIAFEQLKNRLEKEGLFLQSAKKPLPLYPKTVGVITSPTGAAVEDIKSILLKRWPPINIIIYPSLVQGEEAPKQLAGGIKYFSDTKCADVVIIGRGGGSAEDLWAFNSEELARAIFDCSVPVISAVGHETDFTICDFVADVREHTPSAAAKRAVPDIYEEKNKLTSLEKSMERYAEKNLLHKEIVLEKIQDKMYAYGPEKEIRNKISYFENLKIRFQEAEEKFISSKELDLNTIENKFSQLDPEKILKRGYAALQKEGAVVSSVNQVSKGDRISVTLSDGSFTAIVE